MSLHDACESGDTHSAIALIERGVSVNETDQYGWTPFHHACYSCHTATAVALIERGASVNEKSQDRWTLLHRAYFNRNSVENGTVGVKDKGIGVTPSHFACISCNADLILRIIRHGAVLTADDLQRFRDQLTVTEEQARIVEAAVTRQHITT